jgi:hypothetical protein
MATFAGFEGFLACEAMLAAVEVKENANVGSAYDLEILLGI